MTNGLDIFPWNSNFETGIQVIDDQHKRLVELLNLLVGHLAYQSEAPEIERVFDELKDYTAVHFSTEEAIWAKCFREDPWALWHQDAHGDFIAKVIELKNNQTGKPFEQVIEEIVTFLTHWLAMHIIESDKRMAKVVQALPTGISLEQAKDLANKEMSGATRLLIETVMGMYDKLANRTVQLTREINKRVKAEAAAQAAQVELVRLKDEAMAANRAKSEFLANMGHELRSPLHSVLGFSNLLLREAESGKETLSGTQQESLNTVRRSGEHLLTVINNVLELSRIEAGGITVEVADFELRELLAEVEGMFALEVRNKGLAICCESDASIPQWIVGDEVKLRQILINLLSNAVKFTEAGGVSIKVGLCPPGDVVDSGGASRLGFSVEDSGVGIAPHEIEQLFQPFVQTATGKKRRDGTGLGLAISQQFVNLLGGTIRVSSVVGQGSVFHFEMDVEPASAEAGDAQQPYSGTFVLELGKPVYRILIVDDDESCRRLLHKLLAPLGFSVREAADGEEAIAISQNWSPHLIWMDLRMPGMSGVEATRHIKATEPGQNTKVLALTASSFEDERATVLATGCDDFLRKPFREVEVLEMMARHLGLRFAPKKAV